MAESVVSNRSGNPAHDLAQAEARAEKKRLQALGFAAITDLVGRHAQVRPDHPALILEDRRVCYGELYATMQRVACRLQDDGLQPGDGVAICAGTSIEYLQGFAGALLAGMVVAPLAPSASAAQLDGMLENAGAKLLLRDTSVAAAWQPRVGTPCVALDDAPVAGVPWSRWLAAPGALPTPFEPGPQSPFNLIYSSGTTGLPKGIVQSWLMRWMQVRRAIRNGYDQQAVSLCATPLYSNTTLIAVMPTLALGGTVVLMRKFDAGHYLQLAEQHRATHAMLVPVQYRRLLDHAAFDRADLRSLRYKFCTSAPFSAALKAEILRRWPGPLVEYYGLTEGGVSSELRCHEHPDKLHTVGRPAQGADIRFIDGQGRELPPGAQGEMVGRSNLMMNEYHHMPDQTRAIEWFDEAGQRYLRSGDVGRLDDDGFIILGDRLKDMIISGGFNVYPVDIETVLRQHPLVADCAVVGVPSERWGETPVAFVVARAGTAPDAGQLKTWLNARVGKVQRVADVCLAGLLPRSEIGKVLKRELRAAYEAIQAGASS
ncbi:class I adenylate-forming enzyme family protein [Castellaniella sp.]|uniref:class I adenylate-forming enzyme family protein n=1 Tax=Castellaniella sp. TaxID=1955812 RepID=UPI00356B11BE